METTFSNNNYKCFKLSLLFILTPFIVIINYYLFKESSNYIHEYGNSLLYSILIYLFSVSLVTYFSYRYFLEKNQYIFFIACLSFSIRIVWILTIDTRPVSDFQVMYNAAIKMSSGDFSYNSSNYFRTWTYQLGFTMYQALIIKIFGTSMATLKILNALYCMGITVLVYQISSTLFGDIAAKFSSVIYCFYIPSIVMSSVLTNQHLGTFLFYLAFYYFLRNPTLNVKKTILCAVLISMGNIVRPLGSLVLVCILFYSLLFLLLNKRTIRKTFRFICVFMVSYFAIFYLVSFFAIGTGISSSHLKNHEPLWKFVLGFNHETSGRYSKADSEFVFQYNLGEERNKVEKEIIKNRISDWKSLPGLFLDKIKIMWSDSDALYWSLNTQENKRLSNILNLISHASYWVIMSFLLVSVFWLIFRYDNDERYLFFVVLILGYFSIHLLIEIQTRYRYFIMPSIILISGYSFSGLFSYILKKNSYFPRNLFNQIKKIAYKKKVETNL